MSKTEKKNSMSESSKCYGKKKEEEESKESVRSARDWETCCNIKYSDQNRHHLKK